MSNVLSFYQRYETHKTLAAQEEQARGCCQMINEYWNRAGHSANAKYDPVNFRIQSEVQQYWQPGEE